jgi:hypothetical protein
MRKTSQELHIEMLDKMKDKGFSSSLHNPDLLDTKRHYTMLDNIIPIINAFGKETKWLTIGDHHGREAIYLKRKDVNHVICSSLKHQFGDGILNYSGMESETNFNKVNEVINLDVETMNLVTNVDFTLCKETFHHFPRPMLGLYKMLESSKKGIVLIEPQENMQFVESFGQINNEDKISNPYEKIGNFKYEINIREVCKAAWALYLPHVIVKGFNDPYWPGFFKDHSMTIDEKWDKYTRDLEHLNNYGKTNKRIYNLVVCSVLKNVLNKDQREILIKGDYKIYDRPMNKHIEDRL